MERAPRTIVSVLRLHTTENVMIGHAVVESVTDVDANMSDGSRAILYRTRADATVLPDDDLIGLTAQQAYELAEERGILL